MKERLIWLDNFKAFLIFIVVLGHTILFTSSVGSENVVYRYISSFWMACFMFTSGFASYREPIQKRDLFKRSKQLVIPFIVWSILLGAINTKVSIVDTLIYPTKSVWFLWVLFVIIVLQYIVCKISLITHVKNEFVSFLMLVFLMTSCKLIKENSLLGLGMVGLHYVNNIAGFYSRKHFDKLFELPKLLWYMGSVLFIVCSYFNQESYMPFGLPSSLHTMYDMFCGLLSFTMFVPLFYRFINTNSLNINKIGGAYTRHIHNAYSNLHFIFQAVHKYSY